MLKIVQTGGLKDSSEVGITAKRKTFSHKSHYLKHVKPSGLDNTCV